MVTSVKTAIEWVMASALTLQKQQDVNKPSLDADDWFTLAEDLRKVADYCERKGNTMVEDN